ncbi:MAG: bifunctional diaminohydroxyphosphoribosylaminopyrimidine deaminase/5-amino-6-(5-phosphoribosylamino)uracil reductase RibD [Halobacteriovoraceae bacterium]|nr:bifunctional diaminohydroxyphosphoribosylaminopyrimidine deaminase/5-amino-6-(5-phosphoribosylamino)uracil reductase RibD [Halobacteriovoraceae bacterium]MCB9095742.1 bifunctional diaminohydroxyphosphoribosylaminopyrimidine deaminase/5-amino-6-(5-phosphoribosylamino)uracil reductase RibD [Halobacteriovoraceae bacterium]
MQKALELARRGIGLTHTNPLVGAVFVKDNQIIAEGFHEYYGGRHAEIVALDNTKTPLKGATLYCTLEPCCHTHKKTPPCVPALIQAGIERIVVASLDPNPQVKGRGLEQLAQAGIKSQSGVLEKEARLLNQSYLKNFQSDLPYIHLKWAQTRDGFLARDDGTSKWISSEKSREFVHWMRAGADAVAIGSGTLLQDNPLLNVRNIPVVSHSHFQQPQRLVFSRKPVKELNKYQVFQGDSPAKNVLINFQDRERTLLTLKSLKSQDQISYLFIETGPTLAKLMLESGLVDRLSIFTGDCEFGSGKKVELEIPSPTHHIQTSIEKDILEDFYFQLY